MYFFLKDIKEPLVEDSRDFAKRGAVRSSRFRWPISIDHDGNAVVRIRFRVDSGKYTVAPLRQRFCFSKIVTFLIVAFAGCVYPAAL